MIEKAVDLIETLEFVLDYKRVPECLVKEKDCPCPPNDGDPMGCYVPEERKVYICIDRIKNFIKEYEIKCDYEMVRNIVSLHEHIHAYFHQKLGQFYNLNNHVEEPVTEFLTFYTIFSYKQEYINCFLQINKHLLRHYQYWEFIWGKSSPYITLTYNNEHISIKDFVSELLRSYNKEVVFKTLVETIVIILKHTVGKDWNTFRKEMEFSFLKVFNINLKISLLEGGVKL